MVRIPQTPEPEDRSTAFLKELSRRLLEISRSSSGGQFMFLRQKGKEKQRWVLVLSGVPDFRIDIAADDLNSILNKLNQAK